MGKKHQKRKTKEAANEEDDFTNERGRTVAEESIAAIKDGNPFPLEWDPEQGVPIGDHASKFATWIGVCTRQLIPIDLDSIKSWNPRLKAEFLNLMKVPPQSQNIPTKKTTPPSAPSSKSSNNIGANSGKQVKDTPLITTSTKQLTQGEASSKAHSFPTLEVRSIPPKYTKLEYKLKLRTETMRALHKEAEKMVKTEELICIPLEEEIIGRDEYSALSWDFILVWCDLDWIDTHHLYVWIKFLSTMIARLNIPYDHYGFTCPYMMSLFIKNVEYEDRVNYLASRFSIGKKLIFAPYNESAQHWVLTAISPSSKKAYWVNSAHAPPSETFKTLIKNAFQKKRDSDALERLEPEKEVIFYDIVECPKQPNSSSCGYYVCRFMWELINAKYVTIPQRYMLQQRVETYTDRQIDEIRDLWGKFVLNSKNVT